MLNIDMLMPLFEKIDLEEKPNVEYFLHKNELYQITYPEYDSDFDLEFDAVRSMN